MQIKLSDHFTYGRLLRYTLPSIIMMIFTSLYSVVDGLFVSNLVGDLALSAVNIAFPITMIIGVPMAYLYNVYEVKGRNFLQVMIILCSMSAPFLGNFSGNGHKLKNWKLTAHTNSTQYAGLFGYVGESGVVSDLVIDGTCSIGLYLNGGTIAGRLFGNVSNCRVLPSALLSKAAGGTWGGIAGRIDNSGSVIDCYVGSDITLTGASNRVGGITSSNNGTIIGCQYAGSLNGTAANHIGGIAAENGGSISDCIVSGVVNAQYYVGGITSNNLSTGSISNCLITARLCTPSKWISQVR